MTQISLLDFSWQPSGCLQQRTGERADIYLDFRHFARTDAPEQPLPPREAPRKFFSDYHPGGGLESGPSPVAEQ